MELKELFDKREEFDKGRFIKEFRNAVLRAGHHEQICTKCGASFIPIIHGGTFHPDDGLRCSSCSGFEVAR
jgi:DNA-directed RNA polymerase subunit RPC12/RpoP